jgi:hypothetical protein
LLSAIDVWPDQLFASSLSCLATDLGILSSNFDLSLTASIFKFGFTAEEIELLRLFPVAAACSFFSSKWSKAEYIPELEAFANNEHCMQFAYAKLFLAFFSITTTYSRIADESQLFFDKSSLNQQNASIGSNVSLVNNLPVKYLSKSVYVQTEYKRYVDTYLRLSSQLLLQAKHAEIQSTPHPPYRAMCVMLEYFLKLSSGVVEIDAIDKYLSHDLIRSSLLDISLGKIRFEDTLGTFSHDSLGLK